jgi:muramoyltetrapeptide carboxypeptidase LdcA involved in peptidoglycan recycling
VVARHFGKDPSHNRSNDTSQERHKARFLGDFHDPQPQRHHSDKPDRYGHRIARRIDCRLCDILNFAVDSSQKYGNNNQAKPNVPSFSFSELQTWVPGSAEGELTGGCLSLVVASLGTPYELSTDGKILLLEDLGEPPYRIDRMLTQLRLARKLDRIAGLLLGNFQDCEPTNSAYTLKETLRDLLGNMEVPVLAHFPAGHGTENWALSLGTRVRLDASSHRVEFLEPAVAPRI